MRDHCFSAGGRTSTSGRINSSRSIRSNASHPFFQRKRTLDEFPMDHSLHDTHRFFQERRVTQAKQQQNLVSKNGESKQLSSYSRKRFETALTIKGEDSLPPPSPEERTLFWDETRPSWSHRRHVSMSARPVTKPIELSPRPGSGPPGGATVAEGRGGRGGGSPISRPAFNHLRGNNSAYPTIRRLLIESNAEYRVVCPTADCKYDKCRKSPIDCSSKSDFLLIPLEDEEETGEESNKEEKEEEDDVRTDRDVEDRLQEEMFQMSKMEVAESLLESRLPSILDAEEEDKMLKKKSAFQRKQTYMSKKSMFVKISIAEEENEDEKKEDDEDNPASPWHCWVDDATVSSIASKKSDPEVLTADASPSPSPAPEVVVDHPPPPVIEGQIPSATTVKSGGKKSPGSVPKKTSSTSQDGRRKSSKGKRKGGKQSIEIVEEIIELPPPPPPPVIIEEVVEEIKVEEEPRKPVLPPYICPSSVIKSTQAEIKLWLHKSTFSAANRLLPIY